MKIKVYELLFVLCLIAIFFFSSQTGPISKALTTEGIAKVVVQKDTLSVSEEKGLIEKLITPVRKSAHFLEYFVLGILTYLVFKTFSKGTKKVILFSIFFCIFYACTDEIHQLFVQGRCGRIFDVLIDSAGSFTGIMLFYLVSRKRRKKGVLNESI